MTAFCTKLLSADPSKLTISTISSAGLTTQQRNASLAAQYGADQLGGTRCLSLSTTALAGPLKEVQAKSPLEWCT